VSEPVAPYITNKTTLPTATPTNQTETGAPRTLKTVTISGKVDIANYHQVFQSFLMPLSKNKVEIEIRIKGHTTQTIPLTENSEQYKIVNESAKLLGLKFEEE